MFFSKKELRHLDEEQLYEVRESYLKHFKDKANSKFAALKAKPDRGDLMLVDELIVTYGA